MKKTPKDRWAAVSYIIEPRVTYVLSHTHYGYGKPK